MCRCLPDGTKRDVQESTWRNLRSSGCCTILAIILCSSAMQAPTRCGAVTRKSMTVLKMAFTRISCFSSSTLRAAPCAPDTSKLACQTVQPQLQQLVNWSDRLRIIDALARRLQRVCSRDLGAAWLSAQAEFAIGLLFAA